ncbi:MAG: TIGR00304 family membrane protein [Candidatus Bathyarchaeia archaeon]|jgi:uncharacterized membrane protein
MSGDDEGEEGVAVSSRLFTFLLLGIALIFIGIAVIVVASIALGGGGSVGGVIFIGPIPIVFGAGPSAGWLILISVVISVISIALFLVMNRRAKRIED